MHLPTALPPAAWWMECLWGPLCLLQVSTRLLMTSVELFCRTFTTGTEKRRRIWLAWFVEPITERKAWWDMFMWVNSVCVCCHYSRSLSSCTVLLHGPAGSGKVIVVSAASRRLNLHLLKVREIHFFSAFIVSSSLSRLSPEMKFVDKCFSSSFSWEKNSFCLNSAPFLYWFFL